MPNRVLRNHKVRDKERVFYLSWVTPEKSADKAGPRNCASALKAQLEPIGTDQEGRTVRRVIDSAAGSRVAGTRLTAGGDAELTDFVALMTAEYASRNGSAPGGSAPAGEFALAVQEVLNAGEPGEPHTIWTAVIDSTSKGQRANWTIAGRRFGDIDCCHTLTPDNPLRTSPAKSLERDVSAVVDHLLGFTTCPLCAARLPGGSD